METRTVRVRVRVVEMFPWLGSVSVSGARASMVVDRGYLCAAALLFVYLVWFVFTCSACKRLGQLVILSGITIMFTVAIPSNKIQRLET